ARLPVLSRPPFHREQVELAVLRRRLQEAYAVTAAEDELDLVGQRAQGRRLLQRSQGDRFRIRFAHSAPMAGRAPTRPHVVAVAKQTLAAGGKFRHRLADMVAAPRRRVEPRSLATKNTKSTKKEAEAGDIRDKSHSPSSFSFFVSFRVFCGQSPIPP